MNTRYMGPERRHSSTSMYSGPERRAQPGVRAFAPNSALADPTVKIDRPLRSNIVSDVPSPPSSPVPAAPAPFPSSSSLPHDLVHDTLETPRPLRTRDVLAAVAVLLAIALLIGIGLMNIWG